MFHLHCDPLHSEFVLFTETGKWEKTFDSFEDAYQHAEARASGETPMILYNAQGVVVCDTTISPLEPELLGARANWREVAVWDGVSESELRTAWLADAIV
jgi:hypothetical protein